jgi:hypothetical protein
MPSWLFVLCAAAVYVVSITVVLGVIGAFALIIIGRSNGAVMEPIRSSSPVNPVIAATFNGAFYLEAVVTWVVATMLALLLSVPTARVLLKMFPLEALGARRWNVIAGSSLMLTGMAAGFAIYEGPRFDVQFPRVAWWLIFHLGLFPLWLSLSAPLILTLGAHVGGVARVTRRPFILFLRRFSSFSDKALLRILLRGAPPGVPVLFLTTPSHDPTSWDPLVVGFAGVRLRNPVSSMPLHLRSADDDWVDSVRTLVRAARHIVIDVSDESESIQKEMEIIRECDRDDRTIRVAERGVLPRASSDASSDVESGRARRSFIRLVHWLLDEGVASFIVVLLSWGVVLRLDPRLTTLGTSVHRLERGYVRSVEAIDFAALTLVHYAPLGLFLLVQIVVLARSAPERAAAWLARRPPAPAPSVSAGPEGMSSFTYERSWLAAVPTVLIGGFLLNWTIMSVAAMIWRLASGQNLSPNTPHRFVFACLPLLQWALFVVASRRFLMKPAITRKSIDSLRALLTS